MPCCGTKVAAIVTDIAIFESNLYDGETLYCWDSDVLDEAIGLDRYINFEVKRREKDNDGLRCNSCDGVSVSGCYGFCQEIHQLNFLTCLYCLIVCYMSIPFFPKPRISR